MPTKILIVNVHSWRNLGDAALYEATLSGLSNEFPESQITLAINDPQSYEGDRPYVSSFFHWISEKTDRKTLYFIWLLITTLVAALWYRISKHKWLGLVPQPIQNTLQAYLSADLIINAPGGYYYSYGTGRDLLIIGYTMALAELCGKPLYIFPQSIGPLHHPLERVLTRFIFNHARVGMVREQVSGDYLTSLGVPEANRLFIPDTAFAFEGALPQVATDWLRFHHVDPTLNRPLLGISMLNRSIQDRTFTNQGSYEEALIDAATGFIREHGGKILLFSQTWGPSIYEDDRPITRQIAQKIDKLGIPVCCIETPLPVGLFKALYGQLDLLIGTRMHSNIFALSQVVPTIAIGYMHKTLGVAHSLGLDEWVIDIQQVNSQVITDKLNHLWTERAEVRAYLQKIMPKTIDQAKGAARLISHDFQKIQTMKKN